MPTVRGCPFPDDRLYDVPNHLWYLPLSDGTVRVGMTAVATALSGEVLAFTPKRVGRPVEASRSCATIESGKWIGPARIVCNGTVVAVNEPLIERPRILNLDPYGEGWMIVVRPVDWPTASATLLRGDAVAKAMTEWMDANAFKGCDPAAAP